MSYRSDWYEPNGGLAQATKQIYENLRRLGYEPVEGQSWATSEAELRRRSAQWRLRQSDEKPRSYDEIEWALMEALVIQGSCQVWSGDGLGCAAQIVQAQAERADKAEAERARLRADNERLRAALTRMVDIHGKPHREAWLNRAAFENAKEVDAQARAALAQHASMQAGGPTEG